MPPAKAARAFAARVHEEREAAREAAHAAWRARLLSGSAADRERLHTLGVSLVRALSAQDDDAALLFLAQLPLDERLKCSALSKRWRRLVNTQALYRELSFDDVALPGNFMTCGDDTSGIIKAFEALLKRAGPALRKLDVRALDAVWCKAQSSRWPILRAATVLHFLWTTAAAAEQNEGGTTLALQELRLADGVPIVLAEQLQRVLPPNCPNMARLDCRVFLMTDDQAAPLLRLLPQAGDVKLMLVKSETCTPDHGTATAMVQAVCAALGAAPAVSAVGFSYGFPVYIRRVTSWASPESKA